MHLVLFVLIEWILLNQPMVYLEISHKFILKSPHEVRNGLNIAHPSLKVITACKFNDDVLKCIKYCFLINIKDDCLHIFLDHAELRAQKNVASELGNTFLGVKGSSLRLVR